MENISINETGTYLASLMWKTMPVEFTSGFSFVLTLAKAIGIAFLIYLVFLTIKTIINIRQSLRMKSIEKNVAEINKKLDSLVKKK